MGLPCPLNQEEKYVLKAYFSSMDTLNQVKVVKNGIK